MKRKYQEAILGGTFDHLHRGHQALLDAAFVDADHVTIGLTTPPLYQQKFLAVNIESFEIREVSLKKYLEKQHVLDRATIIPLTDIYGTSLTDASIQAIYVTEVTHHNAVVINEERKKIDLAPLEIHTVPFIKGSDGQVITSERIRYGEIDRHGDVYTDIFGEKKTLVLPRSLRDELSRPLGLVARDISVLRRVLPEETFLITVGDVVSQSVKEAEIPVAVMIIDNKNRRQPISITAINGSSVANTAGRIEKGAVVAYQACLKAFFETHETQTLVISGEEDLLALPAMLLAPLGSIVLYGQHGEGIVVNRVTEKQKHKVMQILQQFT